MISARVGVIMAYRSRVGICFSEEIAVAMQESIGELPKRFKREVLALLKEADVKIEDEGCHAWCRDRYRWNSSSPDIAFVEDYLGELHMEDYLFIRIGEDINDIEVCGDYVDNPLGMNMDRTISFS